MQLFGRTWWSNGWRSLRLAPQRRRPWVLSPCSTAYASGGTSTMYDADVPPDEADRPAPPALFRSGRRRPVWPAMVLVGLFFGLLVGAFFAGGVLLD